MSATTTPPVPARFNDQPMCGHVIHFAVRRYVPDTTIQYLVSTLSTLRGVAAVHRDGDDGDAYGEPLPPRDTLTLADKEATTEHIAAELVLADDGLPLPFEDAMTTLLRVLRATGAMDVGKHTEFRGMTAGLVYSIDLYPVPRRDNDPETYALYTR